MARRCLVLSASMGAGHDAVAAELARRLRTRGFDVHVQDVLALLPPGTGRALRGFYHGIVRHAPVVYTAIHRVFLAPRPPARDATRAVPRADVSPLASLAERPLARLLARVRPDVVVSTFHLAAQVTGGMRQRGTLRVPAAVYVTDFAVHRGWLHPGNDLHLCVSDRAAKAARAGTGRPAAAPGPVVPPAFGTARGSAAGSPTSPWGQAGGRADPTVLLSSGAWGVGSGLLATARALAAHRLAPVLLCGRDERLRHRAARVPGVVALGWTDELPELMATARLLVDNAAGQTAVQALAAGLPVVGYRPIAGHGAEGVRTMAAEGLTTWAGNLPELLAAVGRLVPDGPERDGQTARGLALFRDDAARLVADLADRNTPHAAGRTPHHPW
ncbi:galactosyldiacylglycerol synthase [Streptomyces coeruleoprunus]|uniref:Galactosyldiacylglycerol synthase n=1 Tax=Streptomyces coeruleoprunus TaxID=285563 RepID=A0ABV9XBQ6_9ACTN